MNKNQLISLLRQKKQLKSSDISAYFGVSQRTALRFLTELLDQKIVSISGKAKNTYYQLTNLGILTYQPNVEIDLNEQRLSSDPILFNFEILDSFDEFDFTLAEKKQLALATKTYQTKLAKDSEVIKSKEMQRLIVEFSWKSSQIEGNTYSLLETENLLNLGKTQQNHSQQETQMILNHKQAFEFILSDPQYFKTLNTKKLFEIHKILTNKLNIKNDFRSGSVGISGSLYRPIDNKIQLQEQTQKLFEKLNSIEDIYLKILILGISINYIQPFEDCNKRTSRLLSNAILMAYNLPLISYRSTPVEDYRTAVLTFYELNSIYLYKQIFIDQIVFFSQNYF
ncbi:MAG: Fic family protein [bacterium]